jgi:hypothetical protein
VGSDTNQTPTEKSRFETNQPNNQEKQDLETNQPGQVLMVFEKVRGQQMMMKIVESLMDSPNHNSQRCESYPSLCLRWDELLPSVRIGYHCCRRSFVQMDCDDKRLNF